jgi:hypothetical protein
MGVNRKDERDIDQRFSTRSQYAAHLADDMLIAKYVFQSVEQNNIVGDIRCNWKGAFKIGDYARLRLGYPIDLINVPSTVRICRYDGVPPPPRSSVKPAKSDSLFNRELSRERVIDFPAQNSFNMLLNEKSGMSE